MRLPSPAVEDEKLPYVTVDVLVGYHASVLISSDQPVPGEGLRALAEQSARELLEAVDAARDLGASGEEGGFADVINVAAGIRYAAPAILRGRLADIEQSVRDALSDEQATQEDYAALREYPARLATVEEHARAVRDTTWESLRPKPRYPTEPLTGVWDRVLTRQSAEGCITSFTIRNVDDEHPLISDLPGRWSGTPEPYRTDVQQDRHGDWITDAVPPREM